MNTLELCKKFAELEGMDICPSHQTKRILVLDNSMGEMSMVEYNPITDLALNCAARDEYDVTIDYLGFVQIHFLNHIGIYAEKECVRFKHKEDIPRAVIECILKSKGML